MEDACELIADDFPDKHQAHHLDAAARGAGATSADADEDDEPMVLTDDTEDDFSFADEEDLSQLSLDFDDEE